MVVSLKTDLRFPIPGQQGHGGRIIHKNWLFSSSVDGAEASMNIYTIIEMAKLHGLNRQKYLEYILEHRPSAEMTDEELSLLAPWNKEVQEACGKCDH